MTDDSAPSFTMSNIVAMVVVVAVIGFVGLQVMGVADSELKEYHEQSKQWCNERGGVLYNAQVIGSHGGLHCDFMNGTTVHMHEVPEVDTA